MAVLAIVAALAGCGTPGAPQLPSLNLARPADDLSATRKGNRVTLQWTLPRKNTDRTLVQLKHLGDTMICRQAGTRLMSDCSAVGSVTPPKGPQPKKNEQQPAIRMSYTDVLPATLGEQDPAGFVRYAVKIDNDRGRSAGLSNQVPIPAAPTIPPPARVAATVSSKGVTVSWSGGAAPPPPQGLTYQYRIERRVANSGGYIALNDVDAAPEGSYLDETSDWETKYEYRITPATSVHSQGREATVEGADSDPVEVFTRDVYPPAQPGGLQAVFSSVGQKPFVDLSWAPNMERDLAGYNVFRRAQGGSFEKINVQLVLVPSFRDEKVQPGIKYLYAISAVDLRGNESSRSEEAAEEVPSQQ
jgi:hypothetical protein